jgi:hypothetical protein
MPAQWPARPLHESWDRPGLLNWMSTRCPAFVPNSSRSGQCDGAADPARHGSMRRSTPGLHKGAIGVHLWRLSAIAWLPTRMETTMRLNLLCRMDLRYTATSILSVRTGMNPAPDGASAKEW